MMGYGYGVKCENIIEGPHPSIRICDVTGYLEEEGDENKVHAHVDKRSIIEIRDKSYIKVGVIPIEIIPHSEHPRLDRFLIEFPQETTEGFSRIWVDESSLVKVTRED